ncbi:hypothetical protein BaRGS_00025317 [Batillaria attramentaria]|uniref:CBF1-interacting co-repressor CIR N-terminal domain-containing protein n=1 Tax=Batillaria attramentaria TaxID=370345 RepID=A0ABD0K8J5_9CAEN
MNILPKKSWHVRTKKNIERVRRDEEKAAEEEKERQRRIALAEQEARTELLRSRTRKRQHDQIECADLPTPAIDPSAESSSGKVVKSSKDISLDQGGHINFFKDIEAGLQQDGKNKEHEAEKKAEQEKWEKNMGLLTYLGQSAVESQNDLPWYLKKRCGDEKHKASQDPLLEMRKHLDKRHKHKHTDRDREKRHHSKHKSGSSSQHTPNSSGKGGERSSSSGAPKPGKTIEQLRAERLRREMAEKQKIAAVVARARGENVEETDARDVSDVDRDRSRRYNSVYNPNFVKPASGHRR